MTAITVVAARTWTQAMFDDLTDIPHVRTFDKPSGITTLTFDGDLAPEVEHAIWARMESKNDVDQAKRADLRAKRGAVIADPSLENVAALVVAEANYQLGD